MVNRSNSTYQGLIYGITRELGFSITDAISITPELDGDGDPLVTEPAVVFSGTKCYLYNDYSEADILSTIDRWEANGGAYTMQELVNTINATGMYIATLESTVAATERSMKVFEQSSITTVPSEDISEGGTRARLDNVNLLAGSVSVSSSNLLIRKSTSVNLQPSEYYVDLATGTIISAQNPAPGSIVRYIYRQDSTTFRSSPVILHNVQSDDFRTKMFEQISSGSGNTDNGLPTVMGADIINELLSVYPSTWGK
jgi:hypothetical protein